MHRNRHRGTIGLLVILGGAAVTLVTGSAPPAPAQGPPRPRAPRGVASQPYHASVPRRVVPPQSPFVVEPPAIDPGFVVARSADIDPRIVINRAAEIDPMIVITGRDGGDRR